MSDMNNIPWYTSLDLELFNNLVEQCSDHLKMMTEKGKQRKYFEQFCMDDEKMEERRRKDQERRKRKRIEENLHQDTQVAEKEKVKRLKMS